MPAQGAEDSPAESQREAGEELHRPGVEVAQEVIVEEPLGGAHAVTAGKGARDLRHTQAALLAAVIRRHRDVDHDRAQRREAEQHVALEEIVAGDPVQRQRAGH